MSWNPKFDKDLKFGQEGENWLVWLGSNNAKVEVKTERDKWYDTGNIVFEYSCRGKPSGISTTESEWWIHLLSKDNEILSGFIFNVKILKNFLREVYKNPSKFNSKVCKGGDDNAACVIVIPIKELHKISRSLPF